MIAVTIIVQGFIQIPKGVILRGYNPPSFYSTLMEMMQKLNFYGGLDIHYITRNITLGLEHDKTTSTDIQNGNTLMVTSFSKE